MMEWPAQQPQPQQPQPQQRDDQRQEALTFEQFQRQANQGGQGQGVEVGPPLKQRLGGFTVACLILNRTIGTGIFAQPSNVLYLTGSPAVAVILWVVGGLIILCIALSWIELGLTVPRHYVREVQDWFSAPRSGGDKNYLEFLYSKNSTDPEHIKPRRFMTCLFGITFILFGNLAGNAIQFGVYMQSAISPQCTEDDRCFSKGAVICWAILILLLCGFLNVLARSLFVTLNNIFAAAKLMFVVATALLGLIYGSVHGVGCSANLAWSNRGAGGALGDIALAMFYAMYSYTGFEQPFYVLAEVRAPYESFARSVILTLVSLIVVFPLTNVGYLCVVPYGGSQTVPGNMALEFYDTVARGGDPTADTTGERRAISVVLALIIFGTIMAQTFTGARVKQEIAKEAIIPFSLAIATSSDNLWTRFKAPGGLRNWRPERDRPQIDQEYMVNHPDQVPMNATLLHVLSAVLLVLAVGIPTKPSYAFRILTYLRVFSIIVVLGLLTVGGLAWLKIDSWFHGSRRSRGPEGDAGADNQPDQQPRGRRWLEHRAWAPKLDPLPTFAATAALLFLSVAVFARPSQIREDEQAIPYWVNPLIGWFALLLGVLWWAGMRVWQLKTRTRTVVYRGTNLYIDEDGKAVVTGEVFRHIPGVPLDELGGR